MESTSSIEKYIDELIAYAENYIDKQLDVNIVRILYYLFLWDINPFKYNIGRLFVEAALFHNHLNLL